ncbi:ribosome maturation factor RimM [Alkaliphilus oremlandii]|uniref:Ribosome maturation factor RimM n=1 Tax=Alkaliphilus oremlandii (strain OhILAs) TaxID=350688 RepID=RIMM_ALKOO|nr:ribosome maturation factor RimM [Alkaliphilus oremlandii]A8MHC3.1 RecName: Full=Ribosome maturation factor RimM [Alkaliphilus oremlandii OhILAs]ABW19010.1 16S rRNA processing protein RimM [Alkaliphilus oremlandii OhILAs]
MAKMLRVGKITNTHGIKGDLKVLPLTDYFERFEELEWVYIEGFKDKFYIENIKYKPTLVILSFEGYGDINLVEKFKDRYLLIDESQRRILPEDTYYIADIIGLDVFTVKDEYIGKVVDIIQTGSSEVYVIRMNNLKEIMIPSVKEFMPEISLEKKRITIDPIEGMIE